MAVSDLPLELVLPGGARALEGRTEEARTRCAFPVRTRLQRHLGASAARLQVVLRARPCWASPAAPASAASEPPSRLPAEPVGGPVAWSALHGTAEARASLVFQEQNAKTGFAVHHPFLPAHASQRLPASANPGKGSLSLSHLLS